MSTNTKSELGEDHEESEDRWGVTVRGTKMHTHGRKKKQRTSQARTNEIKKS